LLFGKNLSSKTFLQGAASLVNVSADPDRYGETYLQQLASSVVPNILNQANKALNDPVLHGVQSMWDAIKAKVPGLSSTLPARRNLWGDKILLEGGLGPDLVSPLYQSTDRQDPVADEAVRLAEANVKERWGLSVVTMPPRTIERIELTPQEYERFVVFSADGLKDTLRTLMQSEG